MSYGNPVAYRCLGNFYRYDNKKQGFPILVTDKERINQAYKYYQQGAELENENCLYELGDMYLKGEGVAQNEQKAFECYEKSYKVITAKKHQFEDNDSLVNVAFRLAKCFHYGIGTTPDIDFAWYYIRLARTECKYWRKMNNVYGYAEERAIRKESRGICRDKHIRRDKHTK